MLAGETVLAVIPARGGSKRVPRKNLRSLGGKPLLWWTVEAARRARHLDRVIVSSDDPAIIESARSAGCEVPFVRPASLADDQASSIDTLIHAIDTLEEQYAWVILLQPTSPLRTASDIDACLELASQSLAPACVSVSPPESSPYLMYRRAADQRLEPLLSYGERNVPSQSLPPALAVNGAIYAARVDWLRTEKTFLTPETVGYEMPRARSVDIDTELDLRLAEVLLGQAECSASMTRC